MPLTLNPRTQALPVSGIRQFFNQLVDYPDAVNLTIGQPDFPTPEAVKRMAEVACEINERTENIGARRLHTVLERLLEDISFTAGDLAAERHGEVLEITAGDVDRHLGYLVQNEDLSRFIL